MKLFRLSSRTIIIVFVFCSLVCYVALAQHSAVQDDTLLAPDVISPPIIDGRGNDACWQNINWQPIAQVWIPYGAKVDSVDYFGRYKVVWSAFTNLLYFLVEVTDNVFVDGFIPGKTADVFNYDIIDVFIDENKSGGLHVFSGKDSIGLQWGTNAANAFSYRIYAPFPKEEQVTTEHFTGDIAGTSWSNVRRVNYASHLPEFALRRIGTKAVWEFSLIVHNDTYCEIPNIKRLTTNGFELALSVIFWSGIQHYAEIPEGMAKVPSVVKDFLRTLPSAWEETRFIDGFPGKFVVLARRSGNSCYIGGINGEQNEKKLQLALPFLRKAASVIQISDGETNRSFSLKSIDVAPEKLFPVTLKGNGGFVLKLSE